jgi:hypothetical protein
MKKVIFLFAVVISIYPVTAQAKHFTTNIDPLNKPFVSVPVEWHQSTTSLYDLVSGKMVHDTTVNPVTDSTEIISIKHMRLLDGWMKANLSVNEYNKIMPALQNLINVAAEEFTRKRKPIK